MKHRPAEAAITLATTSDVSETHAMRWIVLDASVGKALAVATPEVRDGQIRAVSFAPHFKGGAGVWMLQVEHLPIDSDPKLAPPGVVPCTCGAGSERGDHTTVCALAHRRFPTVEEIRSAIRFLIPDEVVLTMTVMPWFVVQPENLVQLVQMATLNKTPVPLHKA